MKPSTYGTMVRRLCKPGYIIKDELSDHDCHVLHMAFALGIEVGELCDPIKKAIFYRKDLDRENIIEELGDVEFYLEGLRQAYGISRDTVLKANHAKLTKRYPTGKFSRKDALERKDKR